MRHERAVEIERQLEDDRAEIGYTIAAIQDRLSPGQLFDQAIGYARSGGGQAASAVGRSASQNPWPLILTGVGLAWLMKATSSARNGDGAAARYRIESEARRRDAAAQARAAAASIQRQAGETEERFQERVTEAKAQAMELKRQTEETAEAFRQRVDSYIQRVEETAADLRGRAGAVMSRGAESLGHGARAVQERAHNVQVRTRDLYDSEPLVMGAVGVAIGTLLGALLPVTQTENRLLGEYGERMRHKASDVVSETAERSRTAAVEGVRAAAEAAEQAAFSEREGGVTDQPAQQS